jgi:hypothetical protein
MKVRAGDTDPLKLRISARGLSSLSGLDEARLYLRLDGSSTNHVDGVLLSVVDSNARLVQFDPVNAAVGGGNALIAPGIYIGYVRCLWTNTRITRHPGDPQQDIRIIVGEVLE